MKFNVGVRETWQQNYIVEAETAEEAKEQIRSGQGNAKEEFFDYIEMEDSSLWEIVKIPT